MKRVLKSNWIEMVVLVALLFAVAVPVSASEKTIVGKVNDNYQIVTSNKIYEIDDNREGSDLAENHVGAKVRVTGRVVESDDMTIITVSSFKLIPE
jgi:hypothetical protein